MSIGRSFSTISGMMRTPREHSAYSDPPDVPSGYIRADVHLTPARTSVSYAIVLKTALARRRTARLGRASAQLHLFSSVGNQDQCRGHSGKIPGNCFESFQLCVLYDVVAVRVEVAARAALNAAPILLDA